MASSPTRRVFEAPHGIQLAWHELGDAGARPLILLHGLFSDAQTNWIRFGHAETLAATGLRVIMPDLRGHGTSARPHERAAYPPDVLASDGLALIATLGLTDYDLGGYSLGGRTAVRMVVRGARPRRLVVAGMGLSGLLSTGPRTVHFREILLGLGTHERGSPEWFAEAFLKTTGGDPEALLPLLDSFVDTSEAELAGIDIPTLVVAGADDKDNGSASMLAERLAQGRWAEIPGNHMSAVTRPELGRAIADFLGS